MMRRVLADTGPLVALVSEVDEHHALCWQQVPQIVPPLLTCWPVITEAAWLLRDQPPALLRLFSYFESELLKFLPLDEADLDDVRQLLRRYQRLCPQLADACLVHLANREATDIVFTLDRRDFRVYRLKDGKPFRLIPEP